MAEDAFGESGTGYSRQEHNGCGSEISQRLMAHMLGFEAPGVDPLPYYFFVAGDASQAQPVYPPSAEFTNSMQTMNSVAMTGAGPVAVGGNWSHSMAADNYGINYVYDFGEYGV